MEHPGMKVGAFGGGDVVRGLLGRPFRQWQFGGEFECLFNRVQADCLADRSPKLCHHVLC